MYNVTRSISIIPNEQILNVPVYHEVTQEDPHEELIKQFILKYDELDSVYEKYDLIKKGCIVVTTFGETITCEVPENITKKQFEYLKSMRRFMENFGLFDASILSDTMDNIREVPEGYDKTIIDYFFEEVERKCLKEGRKP